MSDAGMSCMKCGKPNNVAWGICADCMSEKNQRVAKSAKKEKGKASTADPIWEIETEERKGTYGVQNSPIGYFTQNAQSVAQSICEDAADKIASNKATTFGGQYTVEDYGGTVTLDFQGCRQGGNKFWLDYQGQFGGGGSERKTYFQVMIMCGSGVPAVSTIVSAIRDSHGNERRSVVFLNTTDRPN